VRTQARASRRARRARAPSPFSAAGSSSAGAGTAALRRRRTHLACRHRAHGALASNGRTLAHARRVICLHSAVCGIRFDEAPCCAQVLIALGAVHAGVLAWFVAAPKGENDPGSAPAPPSPCHRARAVRFGGGVTCTSVCAGGAGAADRRVRAYVSASERASGCVCGRTFWETPRPEPQTVISEPAPPPQVRTLCCCVHVPVPVLVRVCARVCM